jgi:long-chain acyl-CoA synthetase
MNVGFCSVGTLVMQRGYQRDATVAEIHRHEVSHLYGVPSMYIELLHVGIEPAQLASVRVYFSAAASMPREVAQLWRERYGSPIHEGYGLTETSPLATFNHTHDHRLGSIGTPIDDVELMIVDDQQRPAADEERGEICIRGPNVMSGYHGRAQDTAEVLRDGWFHSGDVGYRDAAGYYYIVDRLKDMINRGGAKVWPREVEEVLYQHDAVAECAVVGRADPSLGERVVAYVRLKPDHSAVAHDLREHCLRQLAEFKTPEEFVFDVELPKNAGGKILKRLLRS